MAFLIGGCAPTRQPESSNPLQVNTDKQTIWQTCQQELKNRGFELQRVDFRAGVISTQPLTSRQWFEFWRNDTVTTEAIAESSLQTIRRQVDIQVLLADGNVWQVTCQVAMSQPYSLSSRDSDALTASILLPSRAMLPGKDGLQPNQITWIDLGHDTALENAILKNIHKAICAKK